jgi:hypothetical protein
MPLYYSELYISITTLSMPSLTLNSARLVRLDDCPPGLAADLSFIKTLQGEDVSSLSPAGFARHPPPTSAGLFLPATPTLKAARGPAPTRPQAASPIFRAALVQTSACAPPFPLRSAPLQGWGHPSACSCYPPPSPGGVRHVCHMPRPQQQQKQRSNDHDNHDN